jgi:hypothetical protein
MKFKKKTMKSCVAIMFIALFSIFTFNIVRGARINALLAEKNQICANMSVLLSQEEGIDECYCYYEGFNSGNPELDSKTVPVCGCECIVNGTLYSIGLLEPII